MKESRAVRCRSNEERRCQGVRLGLRTRGAGTGDEGSGAARRGHSPAGVPVWAAPAMGCGVPAFPAGPPDRRPDSGPGEKLGRQAGPGVHSPRVQGGGRTQPGGTSVGTGDGGGGREPDNRGRRVRGASQQLGLRRQDSGGGGPDLFRGDTTDGGAGGQGGEREPQAHAA